MPTSPLDKRPTQLVKRLGNQLALSLEQLVEAKLTRDQAQRHVLPTPTKRVSEMASAARARRSASIAFEKRLQLTRQRDLTPQNPSADEVDAQHHHDQHERR